MPDEQHQVRDYIRLALIAMCLLGAAALTSAVTQGLSARSSAADRRVLEDDLGVFQDQLADAEAQADALQMTLDCRYVLSADVNRIQADIFVTTAQALAAARRRDAPAVDLYTTRLDSLADDLERASDLRARAVSICDTEPENVLG